MLIVGVLVDDGFPFRLLLFDGAVGIVDHKHTPHDEEREDEECDHRCDELKEIDMARKPRWIAHQYSRERLRLCCVENPQWHEKHQAQAQNQQSHHEEGEEKESPMAESCLEALPQVGAHVNGFHHVFHVEIIDGQQHQLEYQPEYQDNADGSQHGGREERLCRLCLWECGGMEWIGALRGLNGSDMMDDSQHDGDGQDDGYDEIYRQLENRKFGVLQDVPSQGELVEHREETRQDPNQDDDRQNHQGVLEYSKSERRLGMLEEGMRSVGSGEHVGCHDEGEHQGRNPQTAEDGLQIRAEERIGRLDAC